MTEKASETKYRGVIPGSPFEQVIDHLIDQEWLDADKVDGLTEAIQEARRTTDLNKGGNLRELRRKVMKATGGTFDIYNTTRDIAKLKGQDWGPLNIIESLLEPDG